MRAAIEQFSAAIGADPLLVQGAGGNISWKEGATLWVKASGTWLAEASQKDIFVPVDLAHLQNALASGDFSAGPRPVGPSALRPSIETLLHALMRHPVVAHLHAVDILAHLVRADFPHTIAKTLADAGISWVGVPYCKPGADLARAVAEGLVRVPGADVVMLQNHGVVIGGRDVAELRETLGRLTGLLQSPGSVAAPPPDIVISGRLAEHYAPVPDAAIHQLAVIPALFGRLEKDWALYPDHVVFLGARPVCVRCEADFLEAFPDPAQWPEILFLEGRGVLAKKGLGLATLVQLRCYYDVLVRVDSAVPLNVLVTAQIAELLNWDAEKYRMSISK